MSNISNISFINKLVAAALVSGVAITAFALISDGDISSDDINEIFDEALEENTELVTKLCKENLNETTEAQEFLENISGSSFTVDNNQLATVIKRCDEILNSTTTDMKPFIQEEKRLCIHKLNKIKEADIESILLTEKLSRFLSIE